MPRYRSAVVWLSTAELFCCEQNWSNEKPEKSKEKID